MKVIDISRELFSTPVYPGDPVPRRELVRRMELGDSYNLSGFYTGCHSATHVDAPRHFIDDGKTVDEMELSCFVGRCTVVAAQGIVTGADIDRIMPYCEKMLLFKGGGEAFLSTSAAFALASAGVTLVGTDAWSIGAPHAEEGPHVELLSAEIPILEGLDLSQVEEGTYTLIAFPLFLKGAEASPVRAVLLDELD
ncbi:MAG: cyclase family protein [Anaeromassilibacillus sp.]